MSQFVMLDDDKPLRPRPRTTHQGRVRGRRQNFGLEASLSSGLNITGYNHSASVTAGRPQTVSRKLSSTLSPNTDRISFFFHRHILWKIRNGVVKTQHHTYDSNKMQISNQIKSNSFDKRTTSPLTNCCIIAMRRSVCLNMSTVTLTTYI